MGREAGRRAAATPRHGPNGQVVSRPPLPDATGHDGALGRATPTPRFPSGSEKAAAHRLGLSHSTVKHHLANARSKVGAETTAQLVWILAPRLPEPEGTADSDDN